MPKPVRIARVLMFVAGGLTLVMVLALLAVVGVTARSLGAAAWFALPGVLSLALAARVPRGGTGLRRGIIALQILFILLSLSRLGQGDPRGLTNLVLPIVILVLISRPESRRFFSGPAVLY